MVFENIGEGRRVSDLAERAQVTKQSMAQLVEYLERNGYVERIPDPADRRAKIVRLTPHGRASAEAAGAILEEIYADWLRLLGPTGFAERQWMLSTIAGSEKLRNNERQDR